MPISDQNGSKAIPFGAALSDLFTSEAGGVRHEIRPISMRYFINSFREREQHSGEVSVLKISSLTKSVIFFRGRNSFGS